MFFSQKIREPSSADRALILLKEVAAVLSNNANQKNTAFFAPIYGDFAEATRDISQAQKTLSPSTAFQALCNSGIFQALDLVFLETARVTPKRNGRTKALHFQTAVLTALGGMVDAAESLEGIRRALYASIQRGDIQRVALERRNCLDIFSTPDAAKNLRTQMDALEKEFAPKQQTPPTLPAAANRGTLADSDRKIEEAPVVPAELTQEELDQLHAQSHSPEAGAAGITVAGIPEATAPLAPKDHELTIEEQERMLAAAAEAAAKAAGAHLITSPAAAGGDGAELGVQGQGSRATSAARDAQAAAPAASAPVHSDDQDATYS